jgi:hypothetical protein
MVKEKEITNHDIDEMGEVAAHNLINHLNGSFRKENNF